MNHFHEGRLFSLLNDDKLVAGAILKMQDNAFIFIEFLWTQLSSTKDIPDYQYRIRVSN